MRGERSERQPGGEAARTSVRLERILRDLEHVFMREGFLHFRTEELAARLHCSKRALYQLASSREALFELVIERWLANLRAAGEASALAAPDAFSAMTAYLRVAVVATREASAQFVRDLARFPAGHRRLMAHQRSRIAGLERLIETGVRQGVFRGVHAKLVAEVLLLAVARIVDPDVLASVGLSMSEAFEELYSTFEYGLAPRDGKKAAGRGKAARPGAPGIKRRKPAEAPAPTWPGPVTFTL